MSFLPAEELDDDYNSDDGFTGDEDFLKDYLSIQNYESAKKVPSQSQTHKRDDQTKPKPFVLKSNNSGFGMSSTSSEEPHKRFGLRSVPHRNGSSIKSGQAFYSEEDFKLASIKGNIDLVKKCVNQGMTVNQPLLRGWTSLMYASNNAKCALVEFLLNAEADANCHDDMYTALMCACCANVHCEEDVLACANLLINARADVNAKDRYHSTPLMLASKVGHLETVKLLLDKGAKVNDQDSRGWTALTMATQKSHKTTVMTLLEAGADCNIKHQDKLTVKDLAAHLPTDEMLALLEHRPFIASNYGDDLSVAAFAESASNHCLLDSGDASMRATDLRYGELELFLYGLDLPHLLPLLRKHVIDLSLLLTLTEQDLINVGVEQVGARKKILDACQAVHKRNWDASSLVSIHFNKRISCADAVAMIANISKHIRYVASTATYVTEQIKKHPETVMQPTDRVNPSQLMRHVEDSLKNVVSLKEHLVQLQSQLSKEMSIQNTDPVDLIISEKRKKYRNRSARNFGVLLAAFGAFCAFLYLDKRLDLNFPMNLNMNSIRFWPLKK